MENQKNQQSLSVQRQPEKKCSTISLVKKEIQTASKIEQFSVNDPNLMKLLAYLYTFTGLAESNYPDKASALILINHLKNIYGKLSLVEIKTAFDLASEGKIDCEIKHFQTFSAIYLSGVLNSYLEYRRKAIAEINKERMELEAVRPEPTESEQMEINRRFDYNNIAYAFHIYKKSGVIDFGHVPISHIYHRIDEVHGLVKMSNEEKKSLYIRVAKELPEKMNHKASEMPKGRKEIDFRTKVRKALAGDDEYTRRELIIEECRFIAIRNLFQRWKVKDQDILVILGLKEWVKDKI